MAIFPQQKVTGPGGVAMTPDEVARKRAVATALMGQAGNTSPVGHWTAALNRGLQGFTSSYDNLMANRAETEGMGIADALAAQNGLTGGGNPSPVAQALSGSSVAYDGAAPTSAFPASLIESESGGNWNALNNEGYGGRLQFGEARLSDAANAGIIPAGLSGADFSRLSPEQQMAVENWHFADIDRQAQRMGLDQYIGQNIGGAPITQDAIRGMAHLGGIGGAAKFLQSGGQYNPADSNGTSLLDYALRHGGGSAGSGVSPAPSASNVAGLTAAMGNPWFRQQYGDVAQALMGQQMSQQNAAYEAQLRQSDPSYQLDNQIKQAQLDQMMQPAPAAQEAPETQLFYDEETGQEYRAQWNPSTMSWDRVGGVKAQSGPLATVTNNLGGEGKFAEEVGKNQAALFNEMSSSGFSAAQNLGQIDRLESLLAQGPTGASAALQNLAASYGIDFGSAGPLQAANSLIQAMIPAQRPAGSGPMSDKDIEMFKASLPRLVNSPEGNALILQTLRGIAQYDINRAEIADRAMLPETDPSHLPRAEASQLLRGLQSPLSDFSRAASGFEAVPEQEATISDEDLFKKYGIE